MIRDVEDFLKDHYPFSGLPDTALEALAFHIKIRYYPSGETVFSEGSKPLEELYIIRKGEVSLRVGTAEIDLLSEGDTFGYPSLISGEPPTSTALTLTDTILYLIPKEVFLKLIKKYEEFELFFTKSLAKKLSATAKFLRISPQKRLTLDRFLTLRIKDLPRSPPIILRGNRTAAEASRHMREKNSSCVIVKDAETGIVTERDIIKKVVAEGRDPRGVMLKEIMSSPLIGVDEEDFLFDAIIRMTRNNVRRVVVLKGKEITGILEDRDIILAESRNLLTLIKEIEKSEDVERLRYIYSLTGELVFNLFSEGLNVLKIGRLISELSDRIVSRCVLLTIRKIGKEPPASFSFLSLGSEGRREQTLKTDQDNALIYDDSLPSLEEEPSLYFETFSKVLSEVLIDVGFPPCPGRVMVSNPEWRKGLGAWKNEVRRWISKPDPQNTLRVAVFFDFRNSFGSDDLAKELKEFVFREASRGELFISYMLMDAIRFKPPIGLFSRIITEREGPASGRLDIKKGGIFPITQGVRALALKNRIEETSTLERIDRLAQVGEIPLDIARDLKEAFTYMQTIRLKNQIELMRSGKSPENYISPEEMNKIERDLLKDSLKIVREFQEFIERRYTMHLPR